MGYSDEEILAEIRRIATHTDSDGAPSRREFDRYAEMASSTVIEQFGSWNTAIEEAGFRPNTDSEKIPRGELIDELHRLRDTVGQIPTGDQMDEQGEYAYITYYERFGSWTKALELAFGESPNRTWTNVSDAELCAELSRLGTDGEPPTTTEVEEHGAHSVSTYRYRFGSWRDALTAAGFEPPPPREVSTEALLADVRRLREEFETRPTTEMVREHGEYSIPTYYGRFESWSEMLDRAFAESELDGTHADRPS